jgi:aminoglycoside 2'-N-acetyltransferase I
VFDRREPGRGGSNHAGRHIRYRALAGACRPGAPGGDRIRLRRLSSESLTGDEIVRIRAMLDAAFWDDEEERFTDHDWDHSLGGTHVVLDDAGEIVAHAAVVQRELHVAGRPLRTGYVEAVATAPERQRQGHGTTVMRDIDAIILEGFELGALGTDSYAFYEQLGWRRWAGPSSVRTPHGERRTPDEDGFIMVLLTPATPPIELDAPISCEWRPGDVW